MNRIIEEHKGESIAVTSIGLDGEKIDNITMLEKPRIKLYKKMLVATAMDCLKESTAEYVVYEKTNINTPLGVIVIAEITKQGQVLVAGPSTNTEMKYVIDRFKKYKISTTLIDGALFRKSIANSVLSDAVILSTGASYNHDIDRVVEDTKSFVDQLTLQKYNPINYHNERTYESTVFFNEKTNESAIINESLLHNEDILSTYYGTYDTLFIKGAFTNRVFHNLVNNRKKFGKLKIVVRDATKILVEPSNFRKLNIIGVEIEVLNQIEILFVTYNPFSPYGYIFDNERFREKLEEKIQEQVINVLKDLE